MPRRRFFLPIFAMILVFNPGFASGALPAQEADPFYTGLLEKAEGNLKVGRYTEALENLRIALFGLQGHTTFLGKAYAMCGLAHYYSGDRPGSRADLEKALQLLGIAGLQNLDLADSHHQNLLNILNYFRIPGFFDPTPPRRSIDELNKALAENPRDAAAAYELAEQLLEQNDLKKAKKTLEKLVKQRTDVAEALFRLGLMHYERKKYKDAGRFLARFLEEAARRSVSEHQLATGRALEILCAHYRGDRKRAERLIAATRTILTPERILSLPMDGRDQSVLQSLFRVP